MDEIKHDRRKKTIARIHRIQGQLAALERSITSDQPCEKLVIQARTIERAVASLIPHMFEGYLLHDAQEEMASDPARATEEIARLFKLVYR